MTLVNITKNAAADCDSIAGIVNGAASPGTLISRTGGTRHTLAYLKQTYPAIPGLTMFGSSYACAGATTLVTGYNGIINTSGAILILTLPSTPSDGDVVIVKDEAGHLGLGGGVGASTFAIQIKAAKGRIESLAHVTIDVDWGGSNLRYCGFLGGWFQSSS